MNTVKLLYKLKMEHLLYFYLEIIPFLDREIAY